MSSVDGATIGARSSTETETETATYVVRAWLFVKPISAEPLGPMHEATLQFLVDRRRKITGWSGDGREGSFLFQGVLVLLRHFNSVSL